MAILQAAGGQAVDAAVGSAVEALAGGLIVAVPTDTVYGLAVDPFLPGATNRVFRAKRRPREAQLPVLVAGRDQALGLASAVPPAAAALMDRFWPGALTVVLARQPGLAADLGDDDATVGVRCPDHELVRALCAKAGPLATTSANRHGESTPETAQEVHALFGDEVAVVLDGGRCAGAPSTVVDCTGPAPRLLRQGRISWQEITAVTA